ncbi:MAG TPA: hypothetical protein VF723_01210 [Pyrinomonadaceae bacterium]|jgi:hypothetical protein
MSEKHEDANLILKLYELRREEVMRAARNWFIGEFNPESLQDISDAVMGEHSAHYRMVTTYWEMAASFVTNGAIDEKMFNDANGEHNVIYAKIEPFVAEIRSTQGMPQYMQHLEKIVMSAPDAKERMAALRERFKQMAATRAASSKTAQAG